MQNEYQKIILNGVKINYILKQSKGRNLRMQITNFKNLENEYEAKLTVNKPKFMMQYFVDKFLQSKRDWILEKLELMQERINKNLESGKGFQNLSKKELARNYKLDKEKARILVRERLEYWQNFYQNNHQINFKWNRVAIKNTQTRWGSCSSKKNLNFSFKIVYLSAEEQDYLVVHELSHLLQMNHSKNFWHLVSLGVPNYKILRKSLKGF